MKNTSKVFLNQITDEVVIRILQTVIPLLNEAGIEYFIVGAFARDIDLLALGHTDPPKRKTNDLDLAVMVDSVSDFERLQRMILALEHFELDGEQPYKFIFADRYEVDFIPFGEIENEKGQVEFKANRTFVLDIPGFDEVMPTVKTIITDEVDEIKVSSLAGVIFLKLLAWEDRPERTKDIADIQYILENFMTLNYELISQESDDIMSYYENEIRLFDAMVSARFIGRQIGRMLSDSFVLRKRIERLLQQESESVITSKMARLIDADNLEDATRLIRQLYLGLLD